MTLDEAIKHAEEVAEEHTKYNRYGGFESCDECAKEHRRLAKWLKDYKRLLEQEPKQVELEGDGYADGELVYDFGKCPKCGWEFEEGDKDWGEPYCCHCGQMLTWFDSTEANE